MRSALARLGLKQRKKGNVELGEFVSDCWHYGGKGDGTAPQVNGVRHFSLEELQESTDNFSESNIIARGGYGATYKGFLTNGVYVSIKVVKTEYFARLGFKSEIELLSRIHHGNIVRLVGYCYEQGQRMLVYEYIPNGSLRDNLHGESGMHLDWRKRLQIALQAARGLTYLHDLTNPQIIHRDVKLSNILLDEHLNAKLFDFGLSILNRDSRERPVETDVVGTPGYLDPEYHLTGQLSEKSDVYGFGVVMIELITAKNVLYDKDGEYLSLIKEVKAAIDLDDQEYYGLRDWIDSKIIDQARNIGLRKFVLLALACTRLHDSDRPFMSEVVREIEMILLQSDGGAATNDDYSDESKYHDRHFMSEVLRETGMMLLGSDGGAATDDDYYYSDESNNST